MADDSAKLLQGKLLAQTIQEEIQKQIEGFKVKGLEIPKLLAFQPSDDPSSTWYVNQQEKLAGKLGLVFERLTGQELTDPKTLIARLEDAAGRSDIHGIFLAQPLPQGFNVDEIVFSLDPKKDVEGIHPASLGLIVLRKAKLIPPTAFAAYRLLEHAAPDLRGKRAAIVGQSAIVGRPLCMLFGEKRMTVTVCNTGTSEADMQRIISESDAVIACAGKPGLVKGAWIKEGAVVIDVGTTEVEGKLQGDVEFEPALARASQITPVPGGVGPLTVTMLMQNLMQAYAWQKGIG